MSELKDQLNEAVKAAMRAADKVRLGTLRMVMAAIKQREVDERRELSNGDVLAVLGKMLKQRRESYAQYRDAGRQDLAEKEQAEIECISEFMPLPLSDAEIDQLIDAAITETQARSIKDMGKVMGLLKPKVQGRAELSVVSARVKGRLSNV
ncbi:MAG: GatB/YqeY domain-containing protein [Nitrococcus mobilis]|nr:GatB/YqeY domain-containing protein [Nitrococcus mobilis]